MKEEEKYYEMTCIKCGFVTYSYRDMIQHLAQFGGDGRDPEENCSTKLVSLKRIKK